jgi:hypothetical protein
MFFKKFTGLHLYKEKILKYSKMVEELEVEQNDEMLTVYNITPENQHLLKIPEEVKYLYIRGYYLDHFDIPEGIDFVEMIYLGLKTIYIPEGVTFVDCCRNFLRTIEIPKSLITLKANKNLLKNITFRSQTDNQLEHLDIRSNKFTKLEFINEDKLSSFNASMNNILYIAPRIRNYLCLQYLPAPDSDPSSDEEYGPLTFESH